MNSPDETTSDSLRTLDQLGLGEAAIIGDIHGDDGIAVRLMEMGLIPGETIELIGAAPLGDPLEFRVCGYHVSLRKSEARRVQLNRGMC